MSARHTPGPWEAMPTSVRAPNDVKTFTTVCQCICGMKTGEEVRANAQLISAAPDLLAALRDCVAALIAIQLSPYHKREVVEAARAAIAKATGEAA